MSDLNGSQGYNRQLLIATAEARVNGKEETSLPDWGLSSWLPALHCRRIMRLLSHRVVTPGLDQVIVSRFYVNLNQ